MVNLLFGPLGQLLLMTNYELDMLRVTTISAISMVVLYPILISISGVVGVGFAVLFCTVLSNVLASRIARRQLDHVWCVARYDAWQLQATLTLGSLLLLRATLGWNEHVPAAWLAIALGLAYAASLAGNVIQGFNVEDREVYSSVKTKLRVALGLRGQT